MKMENFKSTPTIDNSLMGIVVYERDGMKNQLELMLDRWLEFCH